MKFALTDGSLRVNGAVNPLGVDTLPHFSWQMQSDTRGNRQAQYRITVRQGNCVAWDSGNVLCDRHYDIGYGGVALRSATRYDFTVTARDIFGNVASASSWFATGMLCNADWRADWIGAPENDVNDLSALMLGKKFVAANKNIAWARAYIAGLGLYELRINGAFADDSVLNPAHTDYNRTVLYDVYDVTELLRKGESNEIYVRLGNGFFNEARAGWNWANASWRARPRLRFALIVTYADGTEQTVASDGTWKYSSDGEIVANGIYHGETIDARRAGNRTAERRNGGAWRSAVTVTPPRGKLAWQDMERMRRTAAYGGTDKKARGKEDAHGVPIAEGALTVEDRGGGTWLVQTPRLITGWGRIVFRGATAGDAIVITYGETLAADGKLHCKEENGVFQQDVYICRGGDADETYEPAFGYKGFAYVQIENYRGTLTAADVTVYRIESDLPVAGTFSSSDATCVALHDLAVHTLRNNCQGKPTDTPFLEKNGWLGDVNVSLQTMTYNYGMARFLRKFIGDVADAQACDGSVPQLVPIYEWGMQNRPVWNTAYIFAVEELYNAYGMFSLVAQHYNGMKKLIDCELNAMGNRYVWNDDENELGDWVSPVGCENGAYREHAYEDCSLYATAYIYAALGAMERFADMLGKPRHKAAFVAARGRIYEAFDAKFYDAARGIYTPSRYYDAHKCHRTRYRQAANILPLAFGLARGEKAKRVAENLVADIAKKAYHSDSGILGARYLLPVLCDYGYENVAYRVIGQKSYPSWGYWIANGATSAWETFEKSARSRNHYFLCNYDTWLYSHVGGVKNGTDGYKTFDIEPTVAGGMRAAGVSLKTVRGEAESAWRVRGSRVAVRVVVPFGSTATVYLPTANAATALLDARPLSERADGVEYCALDGEKNKVKVVLGSGVYEFACDTQNANGRE
ncbi:MAG: glycoside hydrolase family 78 protein [Clostridiales bacterium]|nr:glycoside hydrolase family 78 protein [Clostridiales bacterium]